MKSIDEKNEKYKKELDEYFENTEYLKIWNKFLLIAILFIGYLILMMLMFFAE